MPMSGCVCVKCRCAKRPEEEVRSSGSGVTDSCEPPDGVLGTKLGTSTRVVCDLHLWVIPPAWATSTLSNLLKSFTKRLCTNIEIRKKSYHSKMWKTRYVFRALTVSEVKIVLTFTFLCFFSHPWSHRCLFFHISCLEKQQNIHIL